MSSFANLKRGRNDFAKLTKAIEATTQTAESGSKEDTRFWQPEVDNLPIKKMKDKSVFSNLVRKSLIRLLKQ